MRPLLIFLGLAGAGILAWLILARPEKKDISVKQEALAVSKHGAAFNGSIAAALDDYNQLTESFVNWDSAKSTLLAKKFADDFSRVNLGELKKDSAGIAETAQLFVDNVKADAQTISAEKKIRPQREAFNSLTDNFYQFLNTVKYDREKVFLQQCPMAFDDEKPGLWLSQKEEIRNPYLGLHHPTYGKAMITCGETKLNLNNTGKE